jgi:hypothetical protein
MITLSVGLFTGEVLSSYWLRQIVREPERGFPIAAQSREHGSRNAPFIERQLSCPVGDNYVGRLI